MPRNFWNRLDRIERAVASRGPDAPALVRLLLDTIDGGIGPGRDPGGGVGIEPDDALHDNTEAVDAHAWRIARTFRDRAAAELGVKLSDAAIASVRRDTLQSWADDVAAYGAALARSARAILALEGCKQ